MTSEERKVRIAVAIELMESVMLDIVREENGNGRSLTIHTALAKAGLTTFSNDRGNGFIRYVMRRAEQAGKVVNAADSQRTGSWRLP